MRFAWLRLRFWKDTQLASKRAELNARIDALVYRRRDLQRELDESHQRIAVLKLRIRDPGYAGDEESDLLELQVREVEIKEEIVGIQPPILAFEEELKPYQHEYDRRRQKKHNKHIREMRRINRRIDRYR